MKNLEKYKDLIQIIFGICLFIATLFLKENTIIYFVTLLFSYIILSYEIWIHVYHNIQKRKIFDENFLMLLATVGAIFIGEYTEAVMVMFLYDLGEYLGDLATSKSKRSIAALMDLQCDIIHIERDGKIVDTDVQKVKKEDIFIVKPGEKIPLDGVIIEGESSLDTSKLTGESIPRRVKENDQVLSGSINLNKVIKVKAISEYYQSTAYKIMKLMEEAEKRKTKSENFITKFARVYTPLVTIFAFVMVLYPFIFGGDKLSWVYRSLSFLVISCPCALVLSVPLCFFLAIGRGAKEGLLFKGSEELDNFRLMNTFVFDKTGTITKGVFKVTKVLPYNICKDELLEIAAYAEFYSNHPIAGAIIEYYGKKIDKSKIENYEEIIGRGITCQYRGKKIKVGNQKLVPTSLTVDSIGTIVHVSMDNTYIGTIVVSDELKDSAINAMYQLQNNQKKDTIIVSGDHEAVVKKVSQRLKMKTYYAEVLPIEKVKIIEELKKKSKVLFVGDGINDALACKCADIGVAMGDMGTDSVIESSDVIIMRDDLMKLVTGITLSKKTHAIVLFNIIFAISIKILFLFLGFFGITSIWMAIFGDVGVTVLTVLHSIRILKMKL